MAETAPKTGVEFPKTDGPPKDGLEAPDVTNEGVGVEDAPKENTGVDGEEVNVEPNPEDCWGCCQLEPNMDVVDPLVKLPDLTSVVGPVGLMPKLGVEPKAGVEDPKRAPVEDALVLAWNPLLVTLKKDPCD